MSNAPKDGDFARYVEHAKPPPPSSQDPWDRRWKPVFDFFIESRFQLLGLLACVTMVVAATVTLLVSAAIYSNSPFSGFLIDVFEDNALTRVVAKEVQERYRSRIIEVAEEFQATGRAPPGVPVTQQGNAIEVDSEAIRSQMPLAALMIGAAGVVFSFAWVVHAIVKDLTARAPLLVRPRTLWTAVLGLATLELGVYLAGGFAGLGVLLLLMGGAPRALWLLMQFVRRRMDKAKPTQD
jgi:hypothetical protein